MKRVTRDRVYHVISALNEPSAVVEQGEAFTVETEAGRGEQCVEIAGARAGEALLVEVLGIVPAEDGYTEHHPGCRSFPDWIRYRGWGPVRRDVKNRGGFVEWPGGLRLPWKPMVGMLGTAPKPPEAPSTGMQGIYGGNMDCPLVTAGATLLLPVTVDGAFLHVGDVHSIQGDGEICGAGGIECRAEVTLRVRSVPRPCGFSWPRVIHSESISTVGVAGSMDAAYRISVEALLRWIVAETAWPEEEVFLLLGSVMESRLCQLVNPNVTFVSSFPRAMLAEMKGRVPPAR